MVNSYLGARSPKGDVGVRGVVDAGELSAYSAGVLSGFAGDSVSSWTIDIGGVSGTQDVLVLKNPNGESELLVSTAGQSLSFIIGGAPGTPGQSRTDALVAYKDPFTTSLVNDGIDVVDYAVVAGTPATTGTQVPPDDTAIRTAISGSLYFVAVIGYVTIANGASGVTLGNYSRNRSLLRAQVVANSTERNFITPVEGMRVYQADIDSILVYDGSRWKWDDSPHRLGTNLGSDVTIANSWTTYATVTATSLGGTVEAMATVNVANLSSGSYKTYDIRVQCDGVTVGSAISALGAIFITGASPYYGSANTFSSTPAAGSHTWTFQMQASLAASVGIKAPRLTINEI